MIHNAKINDNEYNNIDSDTTITDDDGSDSDNGSDHPDDDVCWTYSILPTDEDRETIINDALDEDRKSVV